MTVAFALLLICGCFAISVNAWLTSEAQRCQKFGDLSAECVAPQGLVTVIFSVVIVFASCVLAWLALKSKKSDSTDVQ
jgi:hypothetical protein